MPLTVLISGPGGEVNYPIPAGSTAFHDMGSNGIDVQFQANGDANGFILNARRIDSDPGGSFSGNSASAPGGGTITPDRVSADRYWAADPTGLDGSAQYTISFDTAGVPGITDPDSLVLLKRNDSGSSWTALNTTRSGSVLSAAGLTSFSEFGIGTSGAGNPLPVGLSVMTAE
jgi:hypothetical protein